MSSGTDALIAALIALGIGPGDEVIVPVFTFFATASAVRRVGAKPVFVDILRDCFTMDPTRLIAAVTPATKAIIPVHLYGQSAAIDLISFVAKSCNLRVIEDACQAIGGESQDGQGLGSIGDIGCFSFFPSKNLGGFGDAGLATTNDEDLARRLIAVRNHGMIKPYEHEFLGGNFRMDELQAALLRVKLRYLPEMERRRQENAAYYKEALANSKVVLPPVVRGKHVWNQFTIRVPAAKRASVQKGLQAAGIDAVVYYPHLVRDHACLSPCGGAAYMGEAVQACKEVLSIPVSSELTEEQRAYPEDTAAFFRDSLHAER